MKLIFNLTDINQHSLIPTVLQQCLPSGGASGEIYSGQYKNTTNMVTMKDHHDCCYTCCEQGYYVMDYAIATVEYI